MQQKYISLISIIVPCYNYGHFLPETLESLLAQSWQNWECIIVDDGSTDNTKAVANHFMRRDTRIKYLHQSNQGLSSARNAGLAVSQGDFVQFLDADDGIEQNKLEKQVAYLVANPKIGIVYGGVRYFTGKISEHLTAVVNSREPVDIPKIINEDEDIWVFLVRANFIVVNAPLCRRTDLVEVGIFNQELRSHEDWEYWIRCAHAGKKFRYLGGAATNALVRIHSASMSRDTFPMIESNLAVRKMFKNLPLSKELQRENEFRINIEYAKMARLEFANKKFAHGMQHAMWSIWRSSGNIKIILYFLGALLPAFIERKLKLTAKRLNFVS